MTIVWHKVTMIPKYMNNTSCREWVNNEGIVEIDTYIHEIFVAKLLVFFSPLKLMT